MLQPKNQNIENNLKEECMDFQKAEILILVPLV